MVAHSYLLCTLGSSYIVVLVVLSITDEGNWRLPKCGLVFLSNLRILLSTSG